MSVIEVRVSLQEFRTMKCEDIYLLTLWRQKSVYIHCVYMHSLVRLQP